MALASRTPSGCSPGAFQKIISLESSTYALPWPFGLGGGQERGGQLLVEAEEVVHALALAGEGSDLSKICLLVRRRSQLEAPFFRPDEAAVVDLTRRA
jgi:hypothetical protein